MRNALRRVVGGAAVGCVLVLAACGNPDASETVQPVGATTVTQTVTAPPSTVTVTATPTATSATTATTTTTSAGGACTLADLNVTLGEASGAAGSAYFPLTFTNTGFAPCTVTGFPTVAYVAGSDAHQVGAPATDDGAAGSAVTLKPGAGATAQLQEVTVANFPEDVCKITDVTGLKVSLPGVDGAVFLPQADRQGCAVQELPGGQFQMSVQALTAATQG